MATRPQSASTDAGQVLVGGFPSTEAPAELFEAARRGEIGGVTLFKRNLVGGVAQAAELCASLVAAWPDDLPPLIAIDQEGGRVARLGAPVVKLPAMRRVGGIDDVALTWRAGRVLGRQLAAIGFDMDFAPVLDVDTNPDNPVIGDRSFGRDAETVTRHALAFADGLAAGGVLACGKHFPGHGDTDTDSHLALPRLPHARERLDAVELVPFRSARGKIPSLMTAHVVFEAIDRDVPATLSKKVITGLLRGELGYDGVVISDDLEMKAVADHYGIPDAACRAIDAGCDALLVCSKLDELFAAHTALVQRAERDSAFALRLREAAERVVAMRLSLPPRPLAGDALDAVLADPGAIAVEEEIARRATS